MWNLERFVLVQQRNFCGRAAEGAKREKGVSLDLVYLPPDLGAGKRPCVPEICPKRAERSLRLSAHPVLGPWLLEYCKAVLEIRTNDPGGSVWVSG